MWFKLAIPLLIAVSIPVSRRQYAPDFTLTTFMVTR